MGIENENILASVIVLIQIVGGLFIRSATWTHVLLRYQISCATSLDAQEALIRVGFVIGATDRFVVLRADSSTSFEGECSQAALNWHDENMFTAIVLSHVTLGLVQFVITAADVAWLLTVQWVTIDVAELCLWTVLKRDGHDAKAAGLLFHFAAVLIDIAIGCADRFGSIFFLETSFALSFILEISAGANVSHLNATSRWRQEKKIFCVIVSTPKTVSSSETYKHVAFCNSHSLAYDLESVPQISSLLPKIELYFFVSCLQAISVDFLHRSTFLRHLSVGTAWIFFFWVLLAKQIIAKSRNQLNSIETYPQLSIFSSHCDG